MKIENIINAIHSYSGITSDSRKVTHNCIYVAIKGTSFNGEDFINEALAKGAAVVITENAAHTNMAVVVENARKTLAELASAFYKTKPENIVMVTGTNGKTSVAFFYKQIFEYLGYKTASIGTLGVVSNFFHHKQEGTLTSPDSLTLNYLLAELHKNGITHVAIEASSHGLDQYRVDYIPIKAAAFTNLTQDHLDYHKNMEEYFCAKARLFSELLQDGIGVLNSDITEYHALSGLCEKKINYGKSADDLALLYFENSKICFKYKDNEYTAQTKLNGEFQAYNLLAAIGLALETGASIDEMVRVIPRIDAAPGRLELIATKDNGARIFLDYAHTPDALLNALQNLRKECAGKLHILFGCGGDRDKDKRPKMGAIASAHADYVYVTDDNPRYEDPAEIRRQILAAAPNALDFGDRKMAIKYAIARLEEGDILLVAGKGHETYQIIRDEKAYFSDAEEIIRNV